LEEELGIVPIYWFDKNFKKWLSFPVIFDEKLEKILSPGEMPAHFHRDFIYVAMIDYCLTEKFTGQTEKENLRWCELEEILKFDPNETTPETAEMIKELEKFKEELLW